MITDMQISVVGGGVAGLAAASALAQRGAKVTLFEQAEAISEVGAGLQISPNGLCVLRALGLGGALAACSSRGQAVSLRRAESDFEVARLDLTRMSAAQSYHFVHRADLIDLLHGAAKAAGVQIRLLQQVTAIEPGPPAHIHFKTGASHSSALVIDAGGLHSKLRAPLNGESAPMFTGQVAWRALIPNATGREGDVQVHMAPGRHIVSYPLRGGAMINLVAVQERALWAAEGWSQRDDPANLRAAFSGAAPAVQAMLDQVEDVHLWGLFRHPVATNWHGKSCALIGDAAHPTLPFLAQGANMALEDAWALCISLQRDGPLAQRLALYQTHRHARARRVIEAANGNAWRYHLRRGPLRLAAHAALGLGSRIAPGLMMRQFDWLYGYDITSALPEK
ncbi:FAD-dependent monooxygenase [Planktotalea arctica]|uniref:FAD-dependent monooxygenase n=1 Tax=Planktotalea arctica TaxID=1481893 RepID=UPI000A17685A|nr:FAD-dependent monooxygenase [Planktotalea arctica]